MFSVDFEDKFTSSDCIEMLEVEGRQIKTKRLINLSEMIPEDVELKVKELVGIEVQEAQNRLLLLAKVNYQDYEGSSKRREGFVEVAIDIDDPAETTAKLFKDK